MTDIILTGGVNSFRDCQLTAFILFVTNQLLVSTKPRLLLSVFLNIDLPPYTLKGCSLTEKISPLCAEN